MSAPRFKDLDVVTLRTPHSGLPAGTHGTVLEVFTEPNTAYLVEFADSDGAAIEIPVLTEDELEPEPYWTAP